MVGFCSGEWHGHPRSINWEHMFNKVHVYSTYIITHTYCIQCKYRYKYIYILLSLLSRGQVDMFNKFFPLRAHKFRLGTDCAGVGLAWHRRCRVSGAGRHRPITEAAQHLRGSKLCGVCGRTASLVLNHEPRFILQNLRSLPGHPEASKLRATS